ncbi:uncharacterized protein LOC136092303 [Hydra vulgaris]|uniref:Uncharacterized protein LOC136092303 n=1 Tax=Hydra vulgaris TaxID=6087 RepID=A0ABM4DNZ1_HYDVU
MESTVSDRTKNLKRKSSRRSSMIMKAKMEANGNNMDETSELTLTNQKKTKKRVSFSSMKSVRTFDTDQYPNDADQSPINCEVLPENQAEKNNENYVNSQLNQTVLMEEDMEASIDPEKWMHSFDENTNSVVTSFYPTSSQRDVDSHDNTQFLNDTIITDDSVTSEYSVPLTFSDKKSKFSAEALLSALDTTIAQTDNKHEDSSLFPSLSAMKILSVLNEVSDENDNFFCKKSTTFADLCKENLLKVSPFKANTKNLPFSTSVRENQSIQSDSDSKLADESCLENQFVINTESPLKEIVSQTISDSHKNLHNNFTNKQLKNSAKKDNTDINLDNSSFIKTFHSLTTSEKLSVATNRKDNKDTVLDNLSVVVHKLNISPTPKHTIKCNKIDLSEPYLEETALPIWKHMECNDRMDKDGTTLKSIISPLLKNTEHNDKQNMGETTPNIYLSPPLKNTEHNDKQNIGDTTLKVVISPPLKNTEHNDKENISETTYKVVISPPLKSTEYNDKKNIDETTSKIIISPILNNTDYNDKINLTPHKSIVSPYLNINTGNDDIINVAKKTPERVISTAFNHHDKSNVDVVTSENVISPYLASLKYNEKINRDATEGFKNKSLIETANLKILSVNQNFDFNGFTVNETHTKKLPLFRNIPSIESDSTEKVTERTVDNRNSAKEIDNLFVVSEDKVQAVSLNKTYCKSKNEKSLEKNRKKDRRRTYTITKENENFGETILQENYSTNWLEDNTSTFPKNKPLANSSLISPIKNVVLPAEKNKPLANSSLISPIENLVLPTENKDNGKLVKSFTSPVNVTFSIKTGYQKSDILSNNDSSPIFKEILRTPPKLGSNLFPGTPTQNYIIPSPVLRVKSSSKKRRFKSLSGSSTKNQRSSLLASHSKSPIPKKKKNILNKSGDYSNEEGTSIMINHQPISLNHQSNPNVNEVLDTEDTESLGAKSYVSQESGIQKNIPKTIDAVSPQCFNELEKTSNVVPFQYNLTKNNFVSEPFVVESSMRLRSSSKMSHNDSQYFQESANTISNFNSSLLRNNKNNNNSITGVFTIKSKKQTNTLRISDSDDPQFLSMSRQESPQELSNSRQESPQELSKARQPPQELSKARQSPQEVSKARQEPSQELSKAPININSSFLLCTPTENHTVSMFKSLSTSSKKKKKSKKKKLTISNPPKQSSSSNHLKQSCEQTSVVCFQTQFNESKSLHENGSTIKSKYRPDTPRRISKRIANRSLPSVEKVSFSEKSDLSEHIEREKLEKKINNKLSVHSKTKKIEKTINKTKEETNKTDCFINQKKCLSPEVKNLFNVENISKTENQTVKHGLIDNSNNLFKKSEKSLVPEDSCDIFKTKDKIFRSPKTNSLQEKKESLLEVNDVTGSSSSLCSMSDMSECQQNESISNEVETMVHLCKCEKWNITILEKHLISIKFSNYTYHKLHIKFTGNEIRDCFLVQLKLNKELPPEKFVLDLMENIILHSLKNAKTVNHLPEVFEDIYRRLSLWLPVAKDIYSVFYKFLGCVRLKSNGISINFVVERNIKCAFYLNVSFDSTKYEPHLQYSLEHMVLRNVLDHVLMLIESKKSRLKTIMDVSKLVYEFTIKIAMGQITFDKEAPYAQGGIVYQIDL